MVSRDVTFHESNDSTDDEIDVRDISTRASTTPSESASNEDEETETPGDDIDDQEGETDSAAAAIPPGDGQNIALRRSTRQSRPPGEWCKAKSGNPPASSHALSARLVSESYMQSTPANQIDF